MTATRFAAAVVITTAGGLGSAWAQVVPDRVQGDYAIGDCAAPEVTVTIDGNGLTVFDAASGETISSVVAQAAQDAGGQIDLTVLVDGAQGSMSLVDLGAGAINVLYTDATGAQEPPQRLELCVAAVVVPDDLNGAVPPVGGGLVPDVLIGEFATGSCAAPEERLVIGAGEIEAFTGTTSNGLAEVLEVSEIDDGYALRIDLAGTRGTLEMSIINQDIVEAVFTPEGGASPAPETLYRCTPMVVSEGPADDGPVDDGSVDTGPIDTGPIDTGPIDTGPIDTGPIDTGPIDTGPTAAGLPEEFLGLYALGAEESCETAEVTVEFVADRLVVFEDGEFETEIIVEEVTATSPDLVFVVTSDGELGDVVMSPAGVGQYRIAFTDRATGRAEEVEMLTRCNATPPIDQGGPGASTSIGGYLFDEPVTRFGDLMAELETVCQPGGEQTCLDAFWAFADITGDGQLTGPELSRVARYGLKWGLSENIPALRLGQQVAVHLGTMVTGPLIGNGLIYNHDYDGNNALSQVELFPEGVASAPMAVPALMELLTESTLEDLVESLEELDRM